MEALTKLKYDANAKQGDPNDDKQQTLPLLRAFSSAADLTAIHSCSLKAVTVSIGIGAGQIISGLMGGGGGGLIKLKKLR